MILAVNSPLTIKTLAGQSTAGTVDGPSLDARFNTPYGIGVDSIGNVFVADTANYTIRKIGVNGVVSTFAGLTGSRGTVDGVGSAARFSWPCGIAVDAARNVYVADDSTIRKISPVGAVTTLAGTGGTRGSADGQGSNARFCGPFGIALDNAGAIYVADTINSTIRKITPSGLVSTLAGSAGTNGSNDGVGSAARFYYPWGIALDATSNIFVADAQNKTIRKISPTGNVTTIAGLASSSGSQDGIGAAARFSYVAGLAIDSTGTLYVADRDNDSIRSVSQSGVVTTLAGLTHQRGFVDDVGSRARLNSPGGLTVDGKGNLLVTDSGNNAIRVGLFGIPLFLAQPASQTAPTGSNVTFSVVSSGVPPLTYQWSFNGIPIPGATSASLAIGSVQNSNAGSYTVEVSNSVGSLASLAATLTVENPPTIASQPASQAVTTGQRATFTVAAVGSALTYQWQKNGSNIPGATNASYTIGSTRASDAGSYTVLVANAFGSATSVTVTLAVATPDPGRLINLSILTDITATVPTFTVGTVIGGSGTIGTKPLLVRAAGPSLAQLGIAGPLPDPKLDLFSAQALIAANDDWGGTVTLSSAITKVGAFPYASASSKDSAIYDAELPSGSYTVQVTGNGATGIVIAEIYDATPPNAFTPATPRLVNLSVLMQIGAGNKLTVGFVIGGSTAKKVLIRAIGPRLALAPFGIAEAMTDPKLDLFSDQVAIASNDNWGGDPQIAAANASVGAFAVTDTASKDAILVATLPPGSYTVQVSGVAGSGGIAIVEVYEVP